MGRARRPGRRSVKPSRHVDGTPWLVRLSARVLLPQPDRAVAASELEELYERRKERDGDRAAEAWLRRQALQFPWRLVRERLNEASSRRPTPETGERMRNISRDLRHSLRSLASTPVSGHHDRPHRRSRHRCDDGDVRRDSRRVDEAAPLRGARSARAHLHGLASQQVGLLGRGLPRSGGAADELSAGRRLCEIRDDVHHRRRRRAGARSTGLALPTSRCWGRDRDSAAISSRPMVGPAPIGRSS